MLKNKETLLRTALLALVLYYGINGRKKLQKIIYLINCTGWNIIQDYRFYHYGPYSDYVFSAIENLSDEGLVEVSEEKTYNDNSVYCHELTKEGRLLLDMLVDEVQSPELVQRSGELINELNNYSSEELEIMASLYYLYRESHSSNEELISQLSNLKPHISHSQMENALKIFDIMGRYQT